MLCVYLVRGEEAGRGVQGAEGNRGTNETSSGGGGEKAGLGGEERNTRFQLEENQSKGEELPTIKGFFNIPSCGKRAILFIL